MTERERDRDGTALMVPRVVYSRNLQPVPRCIAAPGRLRPPLPSADRVLNLRAMLFLPPTPRRRRTTPTERVGRERRAANLCGSVFTNRGAAFPDFLSSGSEAAFALLMLDSSPQKLPLVRLQAVFVCCYQCKIQVTTPTV